MSDNKYLMRDFPARVSGIDLDRILHHGIAVGGYDDIYITGEYPIMVKAHGRLHHVSPRPINDTECADIVNKVFGANGTVEVRRLGQIDGAYQFRVGSQDYRFRFNCVPARGRLRETVLQATMRVIPIDVPEFAKLGVPSVVADAMTPIQGLVLVTGPTGSGKSTLLAAAIRRMLEDELHDRVIITYENPIEFVYDKVPVRSSVIYQSEVPNHIKSFSDGVRGALRRNPNVTVVGELRDVETTRAAFELARTGQLVLATAHSNGVAETFRRLIIQFEPEERAGMIGDLIDVIQLVVTQRLEVNPKGGRTALREYLVFDPEIRSALYSAGEEKLMPVLGRLIEERGEKLIKSAERAHQSGAISELTLKRYQMSQ